MGMIRLNVSNNGQTTLPSSISNAATSFSVADASLFPDAPFRITVDAEIMEVGAIDRVTNIFSSVLRAQEGTNAAVHNAGAAVENRFTAGTYDEISAAVDRARTYAP